MSPARKKSKNNTSHGRTRLIVHASWALIRENRHGNSDVIHTYTFTSATSRIRPRSSSTFSGALATNNNACVKHGPTGTAAFEKLTLANDGGRWANYDKHLQTRPLFRPRPYLIYTKAKYLHAHLTRTRTFNYIYHY